MLFMNDNDIDERVLSKAPNTQQAILDFSQDINVTLLDQVVTTFFTGAGPQVSMKNLLA